MGIGLHPAERFEEFGVIIARRHQWAAIFCPTEDDQKFILGKARAFGFDESYPVELWRHIERGYMAEVEAHFSRQDPHPGEATQLQSRCGDGLSAHDFFEELAREIESGRFRDWKETSAISRNIRRFLQLNRLAEDD